MKSTQIITQNQHPYITEIQQHSNQMSKFPNLTKSSLLALCSSTLTMVVLGSIYTFGTLTPYISSYLYWNGDETTNTALSLLFTLTLITINVGVTVSALFLSKVPNRVLCIISIICMSSVVFVASYLDNFIEFVLFYGVLYGFSIGIGYYPPLKNCYLHLPNNKGLCAGICMSGFGLGSALFNYVIIKLVNPDDVDVDPLTHQYPIQIAENLPFALRILASIYACMGLLGAVFIIPPKTTKNGHDYGDLNQERQKQEQQKEKQKQRISLSEMLKIFKQKRAYYLILQFICIAPFGMFMAFNYKRLAFDRNPYFLQNDHQVTVIGSVGIICNGLFRTLWGFLFDYFSYRKIIITINLCLLTFCGLVLLAVQNVATYFVIISLIYLSYGGLYALLPTQSVRVMGSVVGSKLFWLIFSGFSLAATTQFVIQYFILNYYGNDGYVYCIAVFFGLQIVGLLIGIFVHYDYEQKHQIKSGDIYSENDNKVSN